MKTKLYILQEKFKEQDWEDVQTFPPEKEQEALQKYNENKSWELKNKDLNIIYRLILREYKDKIIKN